MSVIKQGELPTVDEANFPPLPSGSPAVKVTPKKVPPQKGEANSSTEVHQNTELSSVDAKKLTDLYWELNERFSSSERKISQLVEENQRLNRELQVKNYTEGNFSREKIDLEADRENFIDCSTVQDRIAPGIAVKPPPEVTVKPHLFPTEGDPTRQKIEQGGKAKGQLHEYILLLCMIYYLSCANQYLREFIRDNVPTDQQFFLVPLLNTYVKVEEWFRKRLAFIRAQYILTGDAAFQEYLRYTIYDEANATALGSEELAGIATRYHEAQGKANLQQAAKLSASKKFSVKLSSETGTSGKDAKKSPTLRFKEKSGSHSAKGKAPSKEG